MVQKFGEPVRAFLPARPAEVYLAVPKEMVLFGCTALDDHPL
jgi:hypothetical protein